MVGATLTIAVVAALAGEAQQAKRLDEFLRARDEHRCGVKVLAQDFERTTTDPINADKQFTRGRLIIYGFRTGRLDLSDANGRTGSFILGERRAAYLDFLQGKFISVELPLRPLEGWFGQFWPDLFESIQLTARCLTFYFTAEEAREFFNLRLLKEDQWYVYVEGSPRKLSVRANVERVVIAFDKATFQVRMLWLFHPTGSRDVWDFAQTNFNWRPPFSWRVFRADISLALSCDPKTFSAPPYHEPIAVRILDAILGPWLE
jgi:hypothetical protein